MIEKVVEQGGKQEAGDYLIAFAQEKAEGRLAATEIAMLKLIGGTVGVIFSLATWPSSDP